MELTSTAFADSQDIPSQYTCDGGNVSPPLEWKDIPAGTKSFALIVDDPDAPGKTWVHWVVWNIPANLRSMQVDFPKMKTLEHGIVQGVTDFGTNGYGGPCPPSGKHRYFFRLYALDTTLELKVYAKKADLIKKMQGHILDEAQLMGKYSRQK